jgi:uncharacterized protein involved in type VI secretion and phage assembly
MSTPTFTLTVNSISLTLVEFDGTEEMNRLFSYRFVTEIPTGKSLADVLDGDANFVIKQFDSSLHSGDISIPGYIAKASKSNELWYLEFLPKIHKASTNSRSEIYFNENGTLDAEQIINQEIDNDALLSSDRTDNINISSTLPTRRLFCQLNESNWNYVARLCDHWGFHFYFDHYQSQLVIADDTQYDEQFTTELKTTNATPDTSQLKLINWSEDVSADQSYITVNGYDHLNAGTNISANYPTDTSNRTQVTLTLPDVNSQEEADYIAQVRHEAATALLHTATATCKIPYMVPGFTISTDDSDFSSALVIKAVSRARNLNSVNQGEGPSYECDVTLIPATTLFRPQASYPVPRANNIIAKVISETDDTSVAQRNSDGEYKIELLGFENESSINPWVRKAQTTGGTNSVDIPLTPNTEVLVSFVDNNPNCPYIQHALDNSLNPVPVTNANPHHAVIATDGMLKTSALDGSNVYTTTGIHTPKQDSYIGGSVKNYFSNRGDFDQNNNFIDPSSSNPEFSSSDEDSGSLIFARKYGDRVEINEGDKLHWHNGNLYDFGGYWNYDLGNSYAEAYIDQEAPLNIKVKQGDYSGDILENNGPDWSSIKFSEIAKNGLSESDVKPASYGDTAIATDRDGKTFKVNTGGKWNSGGMNVAKEYNASYDYKFGEGIEVSDRVNSLEITHTDSNTESIEMNFHNNVLRSWEKTVGRNSWSKSWAGNGDKTSESSSKFDSSTNTKTEKETNWDVKGDTKISDSKTVTTPNSITTDEKTYNMDTGALSAHNIKTTNGMGNAEMDFSFDANAASKFNFGASTSFSLSAQADASLAISFSGNAAINVGFGLAFELKTGVEASMELDLRTGIECEINSKGKLEVSGIGFRARAEARAEAEQKALAVQNVITKINSAAFDMRNENAALSNTLLKISAGFRLTGL